MRTLSFILALLFCGTAYPQIEITPEESKLHQPIVAKVNVEIPVPEGAQSDVRGSWSCSTANFLPAQENTIHIWAPKGTHTLEAVGVYVITKTIKVNDEEVPILIDFGVYSYKKNFVVGEGDDPNPPPPPPPNNRWQIVMFYDGNQLDNYPPSQQSLLRSLELRNRLEAAGHKVVRIVEYGSLGSGFPAKLEPFVRAVVNKPMPQLAVAPLKGGQVQTRPLPTDYDALIKLLEPTQ